MRDLSHYIIKSRIISVGNARFSHLGLCIWLAYRNCAQNWSKSRIKKHRNARFCTLQYFLTYGFDDTALKFMSMYMGSRKQTTIINGISSPLEQVTYGTAQGSILGPLIFILYVNDIFSSIDQDNSAFMYADDTLLIFEDENPAKVTDKAQKALQMVYEWCQANKLHINIDKTKYMIVRHTKVHHEPKLKVEQVKINTVHQYEYLGMTLDDLLSMNDYLNVIWKKANTKIGILSKVRRFISEKTAEKIYKCMIRPHLDYIDFVTDSGSAERIQRLDNLQKKAIRRTEYCALAANRKDVVTLQELYKIEPLRLRRKRNLVKIMYNQSQEENNLKECNLNMELRSAKKVKMKSDFTSKTRVLNSPLYRGLKLWDSLPANIQKEKDKYKFKRKLSTHVFAAM